MKRAFGSASDLSGLLAFIETLQNLPPPSGAEDLSHEPGDEAARVTAAVLDLRPANCTLDFIDNVQGMVPDAGFPSIPRAHEELIFFSGRQVEILAHVVMNEPSQNLWIGKARNGSFVVASALLMARRGIKPALEAVEAARQFPIELSQLVDN